MNLNFNHHGQIEYNYDFFNSQEGSVMGELMNTKILMQREKIRSIVTKAVAMGMAGHIITMKKG